MFNEKDNSHCIKTQTKCTCRDADAWAVVTERVFLFCQEKTTLGKIKHQKQLLSQPWMTREMETMLEVEKEAQKQTTQTLNLSKVRLTCSQPLCCWVLSFWACQNKTTGNVHWWEASEGAWTRNCTSGCLLKESCFTHFQVCRSSENCDSHLLSMYFLHSFKTVCQFITPPFSLFVHLHSAALTAPLLTQIKHS